MKLNFPRNARLADILDEDEFEKFPKKSHQNSKKGDQVIAEKASETLRTLLQPALPFPNNKKMHQDFGNVIFKWMKTQSWRSKFPAVNLSFIHGFSFNEKIPLYQCWRLKVSIIKKRTDVLELEIPAFVPLEAIWAPEDTVSIECIISIGSCALETGKSNGGVVFPISIPYDGKEISAYKTDISIPTPEGSLVVCVASLNYIVNSKGAEEHVTNPEFLPSGVISSMYV